MKKVAGGLRLDLAAFRELEAFAQLGTDLDAATQPRLDRGYRMVELLKQGQYQPMHVIDQVLSIYAGTRGHLDEVPRDEVADWEKGFLTFVRDQKPELRQTGSSRPSELDDESERRARGGDRRVQAAAYGRRRARHRDGRWPRLARHRPLTDRHRTRRAMAKARALDKRRKSIRNIRKITRTMELIATARFKKAMDRAVAATAYTERITELVGDLARSGLEVSHPLLETAPRRRAGRRCWC